jgi:hypothetical protein
MLKMNRVILPVVLGGSLIFVEVRGMDMPPQEHVDNPPCEEVLRPTLPTAVSTPTANSVTIPRTIDKSSKR